MSAYFFVAVITAVAVVVRWLLDPWLGDRLALVTLFAAVAFAVWFGGYRAAIMAAVLGYMACDYLFIGPVGGFGFYDVPNFIGLLAYLVSCSIIIAFGEAMWRARQRARERQQLLQVTLASIGDAVMTTDTDGRITYLNTAAESLTGWTLEEATGQPIDNVFNIVNEQTRQRIESPAAHTLREGAVTGLANHTVLIAKNGTQRLIDDSAAPIKDEHGQVAGCVLVFRDVTERRRAEQALRESEQHFRLMADAAPVLIWISGIDRLCTWFNRPWLEFTGRTMAQELGNGWAGNIHPDDHEHCMQVYVAAFDARRDFSMEYRFKRHDGEYRWMLDTGVPHYGADGVFTGYIGSCIDISELKQAHESLTQADRRKDEFLATLAHELRNPLAPIRNAVQILTAKDHPDPDLRWSREVIDRQVQHMARLLDDLLDMSRISNDKLDLRSERIELAAVIKTALETNRPLIDSGCYEVIIGLPSEPVYLNADPVRLVQVFSNLLNNAIKYTEAGGHIRLSGELQGSNVVVSVQDDGIGIAADMLPRVFDMFSQSQSALERSQYGLGIGLALVRGLVELHGGSIEARSDGADRGSEFIVRLPVVRVAALEEPALADAEVLPPAPQPRRILVVDDNRDSADSSALLLQMLGYEVRSAYDGEEAIDAAAQFRPDVVLLDIGMPKLNGYDVCRFLRKQPWGREMIIIALTGWGQEDDRRRTDEAGFDHHMVKPVDPRVLMALLASAAVEEQAGRSAVM
jgi:PAS domain S-box-containing protein